MGLKSALLNIYDKQYKKLLIIPMLLLLFCIGQVCYQVYTTGDFVDKGVSLKGGISLQLDTSYSDVIGLKDYLISTYPREDFDIRLSTKAGKQSGIIIEATSGVGAENLVKTVKEKIDLKDSDISIGTVSSSFSKGFFKTAIIAVLVAFCCMAVVVFYYFRIPIPSVIVIMSAFSDIICAIAIFNLIGGKLGTGGVAAFLMLIGYSVDSDILLNTRVLKHGQGLSIARCLDAMKTGMTMSVTTLVAVVVGLIFSQSAVLKEIFTIMLIGLLVDVIMTWFQSTALLRWYLEKRAAKQRAADVGQQGAQTT